MTEIIDIAPLMTAEELARHEAIIERGKQTFIAVGNALREIRDRKGYREHYKTFAEYCKERWGFAVRSAYRMIDATETVQQIENVTPGTQNLTEKQVRPITKLTPEQQVDFASQHDISSMTSREVEAAVAEYKAKLADAEQRAENLADELGRATEDIETLKQANRDLYEQSQKPDSSLKEQVEYLESELAVKQAVTESDFLVRDIGNFIKIHPVVKINDAIEASLKNLEHWIASMRGL